MSDGEEGSRNQFLSPIGDRQAGISQNKNNGDVFLKSSTFSIGRMAAIFRKRLATTFFNSLSNLVLFSGDIYLVQRLLPLGNNLTKKTSIYINNI